MNEELHESQSAAPTPQRRGRPSVAVLFVNYIFDTLLVSLRKNFSIMLKEIDLFLGSALVIIGMLSFESDKYCDGNTADYLSCTRPTTYYYFDAFDKILILLGVFLIILWFVKRNNK